MKISKSSRLKSVGVSVFCLLLFASLFIRYQGVQLAMAELSNENPHPLPTATAYPIKDNSCTSSAPITVLSYNVLYGSALLESAAKQFMRKYDSDWSKRAPEIRQRIASYSADLIGLQETFTDSDINSIVSSKDYSLVSYHKGDFQYGDAALLFRTQRFDLLDSGQFWLSPNADLPMAFGYRRLSMLRYVNWAVLSDKQSHFKFLFVNTHFDNATVNKDASATLFRERIARLAKDMPVIVTGDFNSKADTGRYLQLTGGKDESTLLNNAYLLAGQPLVSSELNPNQRIDHILVGAPCEVSASAWQIDTRPMSNGQPLSDHDPVISSLTFKSPLNKKRPTYHLANQNEHLLSAHHIKQNVDSSKALSKKS